MFKTYIQTTSTLCIYQLRQERICPSIYFPNVDTLALIRCNPDGISNIIKSSIFPNLKTIHYLSLHPGDYQIQKRFSNSRISWVFPAKPYTFYDNMVYGGLGKKDNTLITQYIDSKSTVDLSTCNTSFYLKLPEYNKKNNAIVHDKQYRAYMMNYLLDPRGSYNDISVLSTIYDSFHPEFYLYKENIDNDFFNCIIDDLNHPDATLSHSLDM